MEPYITACKSFYTALSDLVLDSYPICQLQEWDWNPRVLPRVRLPQCKSAIRQTADLLYFI